MTLKQFGDNFKSLWGAGVTLTAAGPFALWSTGLQPPWPDNAGLTAGFFCAIAIVIAFALGNYLLVPVQPGRLRKARDRSGLVVGLAAVALFMGLIAAFVYIHFYGRYVVTETQSTAAGEREIRFVVGSEKRPSLAEPNRSDRELLQEHLYQADEIWTPESIRNAQFSLFVSFVVAFSMVTFGIGLFATRSVEDRRRRAMT